MFLRIRESISDRVRSTPLGRPARKPQKSKKNKRVNQSKQYTSSQDENNKRLKLSAKELSEIERSVKAYKTTIEQDYGFNQEG